jgi:RNA polymerase sigma-70 factor (ECF subfamily)
MKNVDDKELFRLIQQHNKEAFNLLYGRYYKMLYVLAFRYLKNQDAAADIIQQSFAKLWEFKNDFSVDSNVKSYLYSMVKNLVLNQMRNENNALEHQYKIAQEIPQYEDNLIANIEKKELSDILFRAIEMLPEQKKMVCNYKLEEKLSNREIADKMDISINTVKTHYAQSLKQLRAFIEKMLIVLICIILY